MKSVRLKQRMQNSTTQKRISENSLYWVLCNATTYSWIFITKMWCSSSPGRIIILNQ